MSGATIKVECIADGSIQVGSTPENITTYVAKTGEPLEVPASIVRALVFAGLIAPPAEPDAGAKPKRGRKAKAEQEPAEADAGEDGSEKPAE